MDHELKGCLKIINVTLTESPKILSFKQIDSDVFVLRVNDSEIKLNTSEVKDLIVTMVNIL